MGEASEVMQWRGKESGKVKIGKTKPPRSLRLGSPKPSAVESRIEFAGDFHTMHCDPRPANGQDLSDATTGLNSEFMGLTIPAASQTT